MKTPPPAIICIGRNYADHAHEMGGDIPDSPTVFMKNPASVIDDGDPIIIPSICEPHGPEIDYEGELAVILGHDLTDATPEIAMDAIEGYAVANDVTARWWQKKGSGGQWIRGKSFNTFCPIGNVVDAATIGCPQSLLLRTRVNGELVQESSTSSMIFGVRELLVELSRGMTLLKGTVLMTGTPAGVGAGRTPPRFLTDEDVVEVSIDGIGQIRNVVRRD